MTALKLNTIPGEILERHNYTAIVSLAGTEQLRQFLDSQPDFSTALHAALGDIGEQFGLYHIMAQSGPITPACLASQAGIPEQAARIWLEAQAAGHCLHYAPRAGLYCLGCDWSAGKRRKSH